MPFFVPDIFVLETPVILSGQTSVDFGVPSRVKTINALLSNVKVSTTAPVRIRMLTASGVVTTNYNATSTLISTTVISGTTDYTNSFTIRIGDTAALRSGAFHLNLEDAANFIWTCDGGVTRGINQGLCMTFGSVILPSEITGIRFDLSSAGVFSSGELNISYSA